MQGRLLAASRQSAAAEKSLRELIDQANLSDDLMLGQRLGSHAVEPKLRPRSRPELALQSLAVVRSKWLINIEAAVGK